MCVHACRSVNIYTFCLIYMQSLPFRLWAAYADIPSSGSKNRFNPMLMHSWQRDVRVALQGQSQPGTHRVTLCARRSQMKSYLFQQTQHNKQTWAQSLQHSQTLLYLCLTLQSPTYSHSHTEHLSELPFCSLQGTFTEY